MMHEGIVGQGFGCSTDVCDLHSAESQGKQQLSLVLEHLCIYKGFICLRLIAHEFKKPFVDIKMFIVYHRIFTSTNSLNCWTLWHSTVKGR